MNNKNIQSAIGVIPFFSEIDTAERDVLLQHTKIKHYGKRKVVFLQGDRAGELKIVISGWVKLYNVTENGEEILIGMMGRGETIGNAEILNGDVYAFSAMAVDEVELAEIPGSILEDRVRSSAVLARHIFSVMARRINNLQIEYGNLTSMNAEQLLSCFLLRLSSRMLGKGGTFPLPYDKATIASQIGVEHATLSRVFSKLGARGVKKQGAEIQIDNFEVLSRCCCTQCPVPASHCKVKQRRMGANRYQHWEDAREVWNAGYESRV